MRVQYLEAAQNEDGGWGYLANKQSWLEPTAYALLATKGRAPAGVVERAWQRIKNWESREGVWTPGCGVLDASWTTALAVLCGTVVEPQSPAIRRGLERLYGWRGQESRLSVQLASSLHLLQTDVNVWYDGWPWRPENSAWVEPTAFALLALKCAGAGGHRRVGEGERFLLSRRGVDGGWNSGNPSVLKRDVPSYPETTAIALLGLQGAAGADLSPSWDALERWRSGRQPRLAQAWTAIALRCHGRPCDWSPGPPPRNDVILCAVESLAEPDGNHNLFVPRQEKKRD